MRPVRWLMEQWWDVSRGLAFNIGGGLRRMFTGSFFGQPTFHKTTIDFDTARQMYRNDSPTMNLGSGFARPIIDLAVEYIALPFVTSDNGDVDTYLNECIHNYWGASLLQVWRDAMRDSKTVVRFRQPNLTNKLVTEKDRMHGKIECFPPESVDITYDPADPDLIERAIFHHEMEIDTRSDEEIATGHMPRLEKHEILEIVDEQWYRFFDKTNAGAELTTWATKNTWGFVPVWEAWNEYDATLGGGQSDLEPIVAFLQSFHDVLHQSLSAHKYHSTPKAKLKLKDVGLFLKNNYPNVIGDDGQIKSDAKIDWNGKEIFFLMAEENVEFLEARSVLGDSKTLMDFLIDCICIASETPRWAILKESKVTDKDASVAPFQKKISRKQTMFAPVVQILCKMALAARNQDPVTVRVTWPEISTQDLAATAQAIQQIVMAADVATAHEWLADETVIQILAKLFPEVNAPDIEKRLAAGNVVPEVPAQAPASDTQGSQTSMSSKTNGSSSTNGTKGKAAAKRALATSGASNS